MSSARAKTLRHGILEVNLATTLDDKYTIGDGRLYMTGVQALTRLPLIQAQRDKEAGLNTAGFVSGYRGSPLAGYDQALWLAKDHLLKHGVKFQPAVNEELAATAVIGTQQVNNYPSAKVDGVFAIWYGKGPGLDRASDAMKHANLLGSSKNGGVLVVVGDDHGAVSSATAHQCEYLMSSWMMPVLHPASVQEYLDYGILGLAMSRFSGCYVGFKAVSEVVETSATVDASIHNLHIITPEFDTPATGLHARWPDPQLMQEERMINHKIRAVKAFARANGIDRAIWENPKAKIGIVSTGKAYTDLAQALDDMGIGETEAAGLGLKLYKVGMPWPLEEQGIMEFARGLDTVLVIEEKRPIIEEQLKAILYALPDAERPNILGKQDSKGEKLLPSNGELNPGQIVGVLANALPSLASTDMAKNHITFLDEKRKALATQPLAIRPPYFCSGCPHSTSTKVPEGSRALAGTGCHLMAAFTNPQTSSLIQMGGEGINWLGQEPYVEEGHIFQNLGDGTYVHSGSLAIRQAVAANSNITYKILYNDAVAMTGGQPFEGGPSAANIAHQIFHEGVGRIAVVYDDVEGTPDRGSFPPIATFHHRKELDQLQKQMRTYKGVSIIIYIQTCAAEKRRRRRRGDHPDPIKRVYINKRVCEGCGDCSIQSNCISVMPVETQWGRKRHIDQSSCNKDFSCVNGFCPAFVTLEGAEVKSKSGTSIEPPKNIPAPKVPSLDKPYGILIGGIGGTGVVTIGQLLGMAALIEGKGASVLDFTGLAQKGGGVLTHLRLAKTPEAIRSARLPIGGADLLLAGDMVVVSNNEAISTLREGHTKAVVNSMLLPTAVTVLQPDFSVDDKPLRNVIEKSVGTNNATFLNATKIAESLTGNAITANVFLLGYAYQLGAIPLGLESILRAIELNKVSVEANKQCFTWGRYAAHDPEGLKEIVGRLDVDRVPEESFEQLFERLSNDLVRYQDQAYAERFKAFVNKVKAFGGGEALDEAVARSLYRLMAHKDEYEVAQLHMDSGFMEELKENFSGDFKVNFHMAPDLSFNRDPKTGNLKKRAYGPWMGNILKIITKLKGLRGGFFDPFSRFEERKMARRLIAEYEKNIEELLAGLTKDNLNLAIEIAQIPMEIRGYGHIKAATINAAEKKQVELLSQFRSNKQEALAAE
ncbi:MAG: indolepyruvate ferredoxin oxidoreductase family protein [Alphaproteobacteria bacterium]|nr:indolepyruvate ferredoxin oxidoreductase family protein [Alphaproteobacteria bacterium]